MLLKQLLRGKNKISGRNNKGRIAVRHRGGGVKRRYKYIDFKRDYRDVPFKVKSMVYDPNRSGYVGLIVYSNGYFSYVLLPEGVQVGMVLVNKDRYNDFGKLERLRVEKGRNQLGDFIKLKELSMGTLVCHLELYPGSGAQLLRSAGCFGKIVSRVDEFGYLMIKLSSGEVRMFSQDCRAMIGIVSNSLHNKKNKLKAGRNRWLGRRPSVRGVAMNPVDHPHGGGEGKTSGGRCSVSPWGKLTKGPRTRRAKNSLIVKRRYENKR